LGKRQHNPGKDPKKKLPDETGGDKISRSGKRGMKHSRSSGTSKSFAEKKGGAEKKHTYFLIGNRPGGIERGKSWHRN